MIEVHVAGDQDAVFIARRMLALNDECNARFGMGLQGFETMIMEHYFHEQNIKTIDEKLEFTEKNNKRELMPDMLVSFINCQTGEEV